MRQILIYGLILGALLFIVEFARYRLVFMQHSESLYTGIVTAICCAAGIWAGIALTRKFQKESDMPVRDRVG